MEMRKPLLVALVLLLAVPLLAAPVTYTVTFVSPPEPLDGLKLYAYNSNGTLSGTATISSGSASISLEPGGYLFKVTGAKTVTMANFTLTSTATSVKLNYTDGNWMVINVTVKGAPAAEYTVKVPAGASYINSTTSSTYLLYVGYAKQVNIYLPTEMLFPAIFGYKLVNITLNGSPVTNGFAITAPGTYTVVATYETVYPPPWMVAAAVVIVVVVVAALAARKKHAMAVALGTSEWIEDGGPSTRSVALSVNHGKSEWIE